MTDTNTTTQPSNIKVYIDGVWKDKEIKKFNGKTWELLSNEEYIKFITDIKNNKKIW